MSEFWIRTQDKDKIVNVKDLVFLLKKLIEEKYYASPMNFTKRKYIGIISADDKICGKYSYDKAKQIFDEISMAIYNQDRFYEMPASDLKETDKWEKQ